MRRYVRGESAGVWGNRRFPQSRSCRLATVVRRAALVRMVAIGIVTAILVTLVAVLIPWLPNSASEQMDRITFTYWFTTVICIAIFALVAGGRACTRSSRSGRSPRTTATGRRSTGTPVSRSRGRPSRPCS